MQFKSLLIATVLLGLTFAAEPQTVIATEPQTVIATEPQAAPAAEPQVAPAADGQVSADGIIGSILWPVGFTDQCNAMFKISAELDRQIARATAKKNFSCTDAQKAVIAKTANCSPLSLIQGLAWPLAFGQQEALGKRIIAQTDCLAAFNTKYC
ncbi:hypothetical protein BGZ96_003635 [Linnemannia gamsii]|uniref:Uncharacterized protein n=1 Tax=Linnemannia gamsii TaxID=64522 RepID=A0ABQ7KHR8_9FUNG|nr:hypothetical protein BGZ96_003635 [Linnemannia gamsii]